MIQVFRNPSYRFIENRKWAYLLSAVVLAVCLGSLVTQGLRYDIDFTGGTLVQVRFDTAPSVADVRRGLARTGLGDAVIQEFGEAREFIIRVPLGAASSEEMGKRVEAALAQEPALLLLDEPTLHLDLAHQASLLSAIRRLREQRDLAVLAVLHDLNLAAAFAPRVADLHRGTVEADGAPDEVLTTHLVQRVFGVAVEEARTADRRRHLALRLDG